MKSRVTLLALAGTGALWLAGYGAHAQQAGANTPAQSVFVGYSANPEDILAPARVGYSSADGSAGAQLHFGVLYQPPPFKAAAIQWEPFVGVTVADEPARKLDRKELRLGARALVPFGYADMSFVTAADRRTGAGKDGARIDVTILPENAGGIWRRAQQLGVFIRPRIGSYVDRQRHTDDPVAAPDGRATGVWAGIDIDYAPLVIPRSTFGYRNRFLRDVSVSGARLRERHRLHAFHYTHLFYDPNEAPEPGKPRLSLTIERAIGSDPIEGSRERHATTGIYLGFQL